MLVSARATFSMRNKLPRARVNSKDNKGEEKGKKLHSTQELFRRMDSFDTFFLGPILMGMIIPEAQTKGRGIG